MTRNYAILVDNQSQIEQLAHQILKGLPAEYFGSFSNKKGKLFSNTAIENFIWEEEQHDLKQLDTKRIQSLRSMSSGERKKALLEHLLNQKPDFLILVNPFDNLDVDSQQHLREQLQIISTSIILIQLLTRKEDILPSTDSFFTFRNLQLQPWNNQQTLEASLTKKPMILGQIPAPPHKTDSYSEEVLIALKNISVHYGERCILDKINWTIKKNEFWQLLGPNGSGKTTILTLITGDNHKGYGQDLTLFGRKKGSGESVWDIKEQIGYFTPSMIDQFKGYHTVIQMVLSGLYDSVGLYLQATDIEMGIASSWLRILGLEAKRNKQFRELSAGEKRLVMLVRAMIKHPPLLILDEPTAGLDDGNASFFVALVNKIAQESTSTIIFVSHRNEPGLSPKKIYTLEPKKSGSIGKTHSI